MSLEHVMLDGQKMPPHRPARILSRSLAKCLEDGAVVGNGVASLLHGHRSDPNALPWAFGPRGIERGDKRHEYLVARGLRDGEMERAVPLRPGIIARRFSRTPHVDRDGVEVGFARFGGRQRRYCRLEGKARFEDIVRARSSQATLNAKRDSGRPAPPERAVTASAPNLTVEFEMLERAAHGPAADAEGLGQLAFGRKTLTGLEAPVFDVGEYWVQDTPLTAVVSHRRAGRIPAGNRTGVRCRDGRPHSPNLYEAGQPIARSLSCHSR